MASPPFNINQAIPGDTDIVSQHPANARTFRDVVESWLLVNHNVQGRHDAVDLDVRSSPSGIDSVTRVWANSTGYLKQLFGSSGTEEYVGIPPGTILDFAGATAPAGYLFCNGAAVSRTTYATLFAAISTTWGIGDGSTTFNVPDLGGRVTAGKESTATRLTTAGSGVDGGTLGATGGAETHTLTDDESPEHDHGGVTGSADPNAENVTVDSGSLNNIAVWRGNASGSEGAHTHTIASFGGGEAHNNTQPTAIVLKVIKI